MHSLQQKKKSSRFSYPESCHTVLQGRLRTLVAEIKGPLLAGIPLVVNVSEGGVILRSQLLQVMLRTFVLAKVFMHLLEGTGHILWIVKLQVDLERSTGVKFPTILLLEPLSEYLQQFPAVIPT